MRPLNQYFYISWILFIIIGCTIIFKVPSLHAQDIDPPPAPKPQFRLKKIDPPPPPPPLKLTDEQKASLMEYINQFDPVHHEKLKQLEAKSLESFDEALTRYALRFNELRKLRSRNPERYNRIFNERMIDDESFKLAQEYKKQELESEKEKIHTQLEEVLYDQFEDRQKIREEEILRLEAKIQELKENLEKRQEKIDQIVEERLRKLLELEKELKW